MKIIESFKPIAFVALFASLLFACEEETPEDIFEPSVAYLESEWKLTQTLLDPGDGSGTFQDVESSKKLQFYDDGVFTSNYSMCQMNSPTDETGSGTYSLTDSLMIPAGCSNEAYKLWFWMEDEQHLVVYYPCIEGCGERYEKLD